MSAINVSQLSKTFGKFRALNEVSLDIQPGEMVALIGASGSGKSTLIRHIGGLIAADKSSGAITVMNEEIQAGGKICRKVRCCRTEIGVIFQQFNLVNRLSVMTNVLLGLLGRIPVWRGCLGLFTTEEKKRAMLALKRVGIAEFATKRSSNLSGGQQQRAAIARTILQGARVVLADEPIASLDPASSRNVMDTLKTINSEDGVTVLVSLHQVDYALKYCPRTIAMRAGEVVYDGPSEKLTPEFLQDLYGDDTVEITGTTAPAKQTEPDVGFLPEPALA